MTKELTAVCSCCEISVQGACFRVDSRWEFQRVSDSPCMRR